MLLHHKEDLKAFQPVTQLNTSCQPQSWSRFLQNCFPAQSWQSCAFFFLFNVIAALQITKLSVQVATGSHLKEAGNIFFYCCVLFMNKPSFTCVGASVWTPDERTGGWASDRRHPAGEMQAGIRGRQHEQHQVKRYPRYQDCMYTDNLVDCSALGFIRHTLAGSCMSVCVPPPMTNTTSSHSIAYIPRMNWSPYISWVM